jgi:hypothetical protein
MGLETSASQSQGLHRHVLSVVLFVLLGTAAVTGQRQTDVPPLTGAQFAGLIHRISEEEGDFWNDNYVSNEASYLHPLKRMAELGIQGHPDEVAGYQFTQILQWAKPFLRKIQPSNAVSYWEIVTADTIKLR